MRVNDWVLVHEETNEEVEAGASVTSFRGEPDVVKGGTPPHKPSSGACVGQRRGVLSECVWFEVGQTRKRGDVMATKKEFYAYALVFSWANCGRVRSALV
jgi:hypothetical protein